MKLLIFLFIFITSFENIFTQELINQKFIWKEVGKIPKFLENNNYSQNQKPFDVLNYKLDARLAMTDSSLNGVTSISVFIQDQTDSLTFHSSGLMFNSLTVNDTSVNYFLFPQSETFSVKHNRQFTVGETVNIKIDY